MFRMIACSICLGVTAGAAWAEDISPSFGLAPGEAIPPLQSVADEAARNHCNQLAGAK